MRNNRLGKTGSACAAAAAVLTVLVVIRWQPLIGLDEDVAGALHPYAVSHTAVTGLMRVLSDWIWDPWTMRALAAAAFGWLWWHGDRVRAVCVAAGTLVASAVQQGLKAAVGRERPQWPDPVDSAHYAAYPSGHAMTATVVCGLLLWLMPRTVARPVLYGAWTVAVVSVLGVGLTRLYLGVHWFSDVLAGWLLGVALVALVALAACRCACPGRSPASPRTDDTVR
ncbi:phosphatase PAP2 family protein [Streptomyces sp. NPDC057939]|uniref:phosphatase PAP2 family protein n=1 Tax=Streptomyces sp. NPDC057939 TaxID=3346284 RepID=UPI0036EC94E3